MALRFDSTARAFHLLTFLVTATALVLQFVLVWQGHHVLDEHARSSRGVRVERYFSYFTILSNLLVAYVTLTLAAGSDRTTRVWRVLRLNAVVAIAVTGIIHWFFLRPLLDLHGADLWADKLLHVAVPILAVLGWLIFGPRGRIRRQDLLPSAIFPALYFAYTLIHGATSDWYPYPFTDVNLHGYAVVILNGCGVIVLLAALSLGALWLDRRLPAPQNMR
jgi:hypothetical protein